jgi:flagellar assembly protein FliH
MSKHRQAEIKTFSFSDLNSDHVVSGSKFQAFSFQNLGGVEDKTKVSDEVVRQERSFEKKNNFRIDEKVRQSRGLAGQEQNDTEKAISAEVERRLAAAFQDAYKEGLEKGRLEGKSESLEQFQEALDEKLNDLSAQLMEVQMQSETLYAKNRKDIYEFIKRFTKWIVMKEINEPVYLEQLLEKLVLELNARKNIIVKVGRDNFAQMPEVIKLVESKLGQLQNIRVEIVPQMVHPGIVLESENALIDGSLEGVFRSIDQIFEQVIPNE